MLALNWVSKISGKIGTDNKEIKMYILTIFWQVPLAPIAWPDSPALTTLTVPILQRMLWHQRNQPTWKFHLREASKDTIWIQAVNQNKVVSRNNSSRVTIYSKWKSIINLSQLRKRSSVRAFVLIARTKISFIIALIYWYRKSVINHNNTIIRTSAKESQRLLNNFKRIRLR